MTAARRLTAILAADVVGYEHWRGRAHCDLHHGKHAVAYETIIRFVLPFCGFHKLARQLERGLQSRRYVWGHVKAHEHEEALRIVADAGVEKLLRRPKGGDRLRRGEGFQRRQRGTAGDMKREFKRFPVSPLG
jgi:hypothetical protein